MRTPAAVCFALAALTAGLSIACGGSAEGGGKPKPGAPGGRGPGGQAIPVSVAPAETRDVPVYLTGLGTVTAFNSVTVKTRVDGQIVEVAFREGQDVKKGDLLVQIDPRPLQVQLNQMQANVAKDEALLEDARLNLERDEDLSKQGILPQQQLDTQRASVHQLDGQLGIDRAQVDNVTLQLSYARITAPVDGRVGLRLVDIGNIVHASDAGGLLVINQLDPIAVVFTLPEDNLPGVARRMKSGSLSAEAWSRDDQTKLAGGTLLSVDNQIDPQTGTGKLKATFPNQDRSLWPNQFVNVRLLLEVRKGRTVVPAAAVQRGSQGSFAYVMKDDKTVELRPLKVGLVQGGIAVVDDGLKPGEQVVTDGQEKLQAGSHVEPRTGQAKPAAS
jgi:multidrug efflux system membrane fusion protein